MTSGKSNRMLWILEDDAEARFLYTKTLGFRYELQVFDRAASFLEALRKAGADGMARPDLVIADLRLPDESFVSLLSKPETKDLLADQKFLIVSSVDDMDILRFCFREGAADYLTKPFGMNELIVKIDRLLARHGDDGTSCRIDPLTMTIQGLDGAPVSLTSKEFQILTLLNTQEGHVVTREALIQKIWNRALVNTKTVDIHLFNLRRKLQQAGFAIEFQAPNQYALVRKN